MIDNELKINIEEEAAEYRDGFKLHPPGWWSSAIVAAEKKITSSNGQMIALRFKSDQGDVNGVYNIINASDIAQKIGRQTLAKICELTGIRGSVTIDEITKKLPGRKIDIEIISKDFTSNVTGRKLRSNEITGYAPIGSKEKKINIQTNTSSNEKPW